MGLVVNFGKRILLHEAAPVDCHRFLCTCLGDSLFELCACYQDINAGAQTMQIPICWMDSGCDALDAYL